MTRDRPLKRKYARIERERRFLLEQLPPGVDEGDFMRLRDRYIRGAFVRLRRVEEPSGAHIVTKLGQKVLNPDTPENPRHRMMTTLYLDEAEGEVFAKLPARTCVKRRYKHREQGWTFMIDVYESPASAAGLMLAEVECPDDEALDAIVCPPWAVKEVTDEPGFAGATLAEG